MLAPRRASGGDRAGPASRRGHARVLAFLADGESWSSSALALALATASAPYNGRSTRWRPQAVQSFGRGRLVVGSPTRAGIHDALLLPSPLPTD